jgi:hypothetical protein
MKKLSGYVVGAVVALSIVSLAEAPAAAQAPAAARRVAGKPDFNGIWQSLNSAAWDLQDHVGQLGVPPGQSVVEGNDIPYRPEALAQKKENYSKRETEDPTGANCYLPGVPRVMYMPFPFQMTHTAKNIAISSEFTHALRNIYLDGTPHPETPEENWMGDSRGHWEGDTLVVDVKNFNADTWLDHAGNFHSEQLHVVERYTMTDPDHIQYEATIEDPKVFTRPWKISMPLYRRVEKNVRLLEYECVFYLQDEHYKDAPFKK